MLKRLLLSLPLQLLLLLFLSTSSHQPVEAYHFAMVSGNSEFFYPIEEGWNDMCQQLNKTSGEVVTCEHWYSSNENLALNNLTYNKTEDIRSCVPFIRWLIARGDVDAIATKCNLKEEDPPVIQEAHDAGIPVVVFAGPHAGPYVSYIGTDNFELGKAMARLLKQLRPEGGTYVTTYNGPASWERAVGFVEEIEKDNNRDDKAHWIEEPTVNYTALGWDVSDWKGVTSRGLAGIPGFLKVIAESNPTCLAFMYQTPMRHVNYTDFVDENRHRNISYIGTEGNADDLVYMARNYVDGLIGQQTYDMGLFAIEALFRIVTDGPDTVPRKFGTKLINYNLIPDELPPLEVDQSLIGNLKFVGFVCFGIVAATVLLCMGWTLLNQKKIIVKASQPFFLVMTAMGVLIMASTMLPLSFDDGGVEISETPAKGICMSIPWLAFAGFSTTFSALFAKTWRVNQFFKSTSSHGRIKVTERDVLLPFLVIFSLNIVVLICWTVIDPLTYVRQYAPGTDLWNRDIASNGTCRSEHAAAFLVPLGIINFVVLAIACWQAFEARDINCEFAEAKYIALAVFSLTQAFLTGIPIVAVAKGIPEAFYLILTLLLFVVCMVVMCLIFLPKMLMQRRYEQMSPSDQKRAMSVSVRLSSGQVESRVSGLSSSAFRRYRDERLVDSSGGGSSSNKNINACNQNSKENSNNSNRSGPQVLSRVQEGVEASAMTSKASTGTGSNHQLDRRSAANTISTASGTDRGESGAFATGPANNDQDSAVLVTKEEDGGRLRIYSSYIDDEVVDA